MSKNKNYRNYQNYSQANSEETKPVMDESVMTAAVEDEVVEAVEADIQEEAIEPVVETVTGIVTDCVKLRVRKQPNTSSDVIHELEVSSEVVVDVNKSTDEFYKVCTAAGLDGYCMKKFITLK